MLEEIEMREDQEEEMEVAIYHAQVEDQEVVSQEVADQVEVDQVEEDQEEATQVDRSTSQSPMPNHRGEESRSRSRRSIMEIETNSRHSLTRYSSYS